MLGTETTTLDAAGEITATHDMSAVTDDQVRAAANRLTGDLMQVPPMVSAIKIDGKRLHELAREGKEVDRPPRPVRVDRFDVEPVEGARGVWRCVVDCSSGTYIRSLAADLGTALGGGAHLRSLRRTSVGGFTLDDAGTIESPTLLPVSAAVQHLESASSTRTLPCWWVTAVSFRSNSCRSPVGVRGRCWAKMECSWLCTNRIPRVGNRPW